MRRMIKVKNQQACTGCLICEMACSFHHSGAFSRGQSSIRVNKCIFNAGKKAQINIFYEKDNSNPICDLCKNEDHPLCISFCPQKVYKLARNKT